VTTPVRTLRDLASDPAMPTEQFERAVEEAVSRGLIRRSEAGASTTIWRNVGTTMR